MRLINSPQKISTKAQDTVIYLDWLHIESAIGELCKYIHPSLTFDYLFVLVRGAMVPAVMISHRLDMRKLVFYQGIKTKSNNPHDYGTFHCHSAPSISPDTRFLIVEDIIFEGDTVNHAIEYIKENNGICVGVVSLVMDVNFRKLLSTNIHDIPLICAYECEHRQWIRFPWELRLPKESKPNI